MKEKRKKIIVSAVVTGMLASAMGALGLVRADEVFAWGPERTTYTNENPAPQAVFNSITNNAAVGDERDFVRVVEVHEDGTRDTYANEVHVSGGKTYEVYIYYHNDASATYNDKAHEYIGVARDTKISAAFPETLKAGEKGEVNAIISASNTLVPEVWDEAYLIADEDVTFTYIPGSAKIFNDWGVSGSNLSTNLFTGDGTYIGLNQLNGIILGCDEYSGQVVYQLKATGVNQLEEDIKQEPVTPDTPDAGFELDKKVSNDGGASWVDSVDVKPGDEIEFRITYKNVGSVAQRDVSAFDTLEGAVGMDYVAGSTRVLKGGVESRIDDQAGYGLFNGGLQIGEVAPGAEIEIFYKAKLSTSTDTFACGKTVLHNLAGMSGRRGDQEDAGLATIYDKVAVNVLRTGNGCLPTTLPETGPAQIILAGVVVAGVLVGFGYWVNSKRQLKKMQREAEGETDVKVKREKKKAVEPEAESQEGMRREDHEGPTERKESEG